MPNMNPMRNMMRASPNRQKLLGYESEFPLTALRKLGLDDDGSGWIDLQRPTPTTSSKLSSSSS